MGVAFTRRGPVSSRMRAMPTTPRPLDEGSSCPVARTYSRAYLHHLVKANEILGAMLLSEINVAYYQELMAGMRAAIVARRLADFAAEDQGRMGAGRHTVAVTNQAERRHGVVRSEWNYSSKERGTKRPVCSRRRAWRSA
jgi:queuine/archaeosine tRNA-ribosyltransferase